MATFTSDNSLPFWLSNATVFSASSEYGPYSPTSSGTEDNYYVSSPAFFFPEVGRFYRGYFVKYVGSGFTYTTDSNSKLIPTGGNYSYAQVLDNDTVLATLSEISLPLANVFAQTVESVFAGNDNFFGGPHAGEKFFGTDGDDIINGGGANLYSSLYGASQSGDILYGGLGNDTLIGGQGQDTLDGGDGVDTTSYEGSPASVTVDLATGTGVGGDAEGDTLDSIENLIGSAFNDTLIGDTNDNVLDGGAGADMLAGGAGNDTYIVDNVGDVIVEDANAGTDKVFSSVDYSLSANVEILSLAAGNTIRGTGNALGNTIYGNAQDNILDGGAGADTLAGGAGDDTYIVDNVGDVIVELANGGTDKAFSSVDYTLLANVEILSLAAGNAIRGTGNSLGNTIYGNAQNNILDGGAGNDHLFGGMGADELYGGDGFDYARYDDASYASFIVSLKTPALNTGVAAGDSLSSIEGLILSNGDDVAYGDAGANYIYGRAGNDTLYGYEGQDTLFGEAGADRFMFDVQPSAANADTIGDFQSGIDRIGLSHFFYGAADAGGAMRLEQGASVTASTAQGTMLFDSTSHVLSFDPDGSQSGAAIPIATLSGVAALTNADLFFI